MRRKTLFPENIPALDETSVPAAIFGPAIRSAPAGQAASAIKSFAAVSARSSLNAFKGLDAFSSIGAGPGSTLVLNDYLLRFFAQNFLLLLFYNCKVK